MITSNISKCAIIHISAALIAMTAMIPSSHTHAAGSDTLFSMPSSARHLGRGTVSTSGAMDASDVYRFAANTAIAEGAQIIFGQTERLDEVRGWYGAVALPVFYTGAVGAFVKSGTAIGEYADINAFGLSLAKYYDEYAFGFGGHFAFLESNMTRAGTNRFGAFGLDLRIDPFDAFSGRAYYVSAGLPMNIHRGAWLRDRLPSQYGVIANYHPMRGTHSFWGGDIGIGVQKISWDTLTLGASAELSVGGMFFARAGYENPVNRRAGISGLSLGAGFLAGSFGMDGAYKFGQDNNSGVWAVDAKLHIESLKKRNAQSNLALARDYFARERYNKAAFYSERALAQDPAHWNAMALNVLSEAEFRRVKGREVTIIYGGNSRGLVIPYPPSPDALGGISRYAAAVSSLREIRPKNFTIDVGNMMSDKNNELKVELAAAYYDIMNFDAVAPGEGEMAMGPFEFMAAQRRQLPVVLTNLHDNDSRQSGIWSSLLITNDGYSVYVLNLICRSVLGDSAAFNLSIDIDATRALLTGQRGAEANLRAVVIHGNMDEIRRLAEALPEIDIIIAGSLEERFDTPVMIGQTHVLSAGDGNKFVGCFTIDLDKSGGINKSNGNNSAGSRSGSTRRGVRPKIVATNKLHPVDQNIEPHPAVESVTKLVSAAIKVEKSGPDKIPVRVSGVIPHLSQREGRVGAYIKAIQSLSEYTLSEGVVDPRRPIFSPANNRAAFIHGKPAGMNGKLRMVDLSTMNGVTVSTGKNVLDAAFSPTDGFLYYIAADRGSEAGAIYRTKIYMYDALQVIPANGSVRRDLSVSDDGATLLFCARSGDGWWHVYASDSSAAAPPVQLTHGNADHRYPSLSPNGRYAAYLSGRTGFGGRMDLWILDRNSASHRQLTFNAGVTEFCWGDDSETLYFSSGANLTEISSINVHGTVAVRLISQPNTIKNWSENSPRFIRYNGAPMVVYTREYIDGQRRLFWYNIGARKDDKLYTAGENDEWLDYRPND
ncbi:MAG: hypothetical protein FWB94_04395 [Chitinispirillia bacterium]|nr:hypothetical protein [Chitinispirillia bacterium]